MAIVLSEEQQKACDLAVEWYHDSNQQVFKIFGPAGTGKSFVTSRIVEKIGVDPLYGTYTGKASIVMQKNGCHGATTLHSLLYKVHEDYMTGETTFVLDRYGPLSTAKLLVIDEISFVDEDMAKEILSFGIKILVLGDPYQLPPVSGSGYFINGDPDFALTQIHRQAAESPIIKLATIVREGGELDYGQYGNCSVISKRDINSEIIMDADQVLCGLNKTRRMYNKRMRELLGYQSPLPMPDEKLICLRNDKKKGICNGEFFDCISTSVMKRTNAGEKVKLSVKSQDFQTRAIKVTVFRDFFDGDPKNLDWRSLKNTQQFDFGHVVSTHKYQGSQADSIVLFDESYAFRESAMNHLYTGITRAAEKIVIVI